MELNIVLTISYLIAIAVTLVLSAYFIREYRVKKLRASLAWSLGFLAWAFVMLTDLFAIFQGETIVGKPVIFFGLIVLAMSMTLFYYGTSLLFFSPGSFFREKMSILIMVSFALLSVYLVMVFQEEGFRAEAAKILQPVMTFIFLVISVLFYRVSRRLGKGDPRRTTVLLVSIAWLLIAIQNAYRIFVGYSMATDIIFQSLYVPGWLILFYGMILGKAAKG